MAPCNCNQTRPMGSAATPKQVAANQAARNAARVTPQTPPTGTTQSFTLADGQTFGSQLERDAARVRAAWRG